jgi:predicted kinase
MCWRTKLQEQVTLAAEYGFTDVYVAIPITDAQQLLEDRHAMASAVLPTPLVDGSNSHRGNIDPLDNSVGKGPS